MDAWVSIAHLVQRMFGGAPLSILQGVKPKPDLVVVAFGMNDAAGRSAKEYQTNTKAVMTKIRDELPNTEFIL